MRLTKVAKLITIGLTASLAGCGDGSAEFLDNLFGKTTPAFFADRMADANKILAKEPEAKVRSASADAKPFDAYVGTWMSACLASGTDRSIVREIEIVDTKFFDSTATNSSAHPSRSTEYRFDNKTCTGQPDPITSDIHVTTAMEKLQAPADAQIQGEADVATLSFSRDGVAPSTGKRIAGLYASGDQLVWGFVDGGQTWFDVSSVRMAKLPARKP